MKNLASHRLHSVSELREHPEIISKAFELCEKHPDERLETYCYTHDEPCCVRCVVNVHRLCENVVPIDQWVRETQNAHGPSQLLQEVNALVEEEEKKHFDVVKFMSISEEITKMRSVIDGHLDKLEKTLRDEVTQYMETAEQNKDKSPIHFAKLYLQKLIQTGTSVQLLASMKQLRKLMAIIEKEKENRRDEPIKIEFNHYVEQFTTLIKSFGRVIQDDSSSDTETTQQVPYMELGEQRPPIPEARVRTTQVKNKNGKHKKVENSIDMYTERARPRADISKPRPSPAETKSRDTPIKIKETKEFDNIAEIERKLKIFVDKHITRVNEEELDRKRHEHIYSFADDDVFEAGYARVDKNHEGKDGAVVRNKRKPPENKAPKDTPDPEKEKLNDLINNYLRKNDRKSALSKTKSFYFSNPDISSTMKENSPAGENSDDQTKDVGKGRGSKKRRNSHHPASPIKEDDEQDYDHIDYDSPFLDPSYLPMSLTSKQKEQTKNAEDVPKQTTAKNNSDDEKASNSDSETFGAQFQIYSPKSQQKAAEINIKQKKEQDKGKTPNKSFFEKAKTMFRFNKKQEKFDVDQATKDKIFNDYDPMNEPIYMGTPYEDPIKKAAHAIPAKHTHKKSPYEQNVEIMYQDSNTKEESVYETSFPAEDRKVKNPEVNETIVQDDASTDSDLIEVNLLATSGMGEPDDTGHKSDERFPEPEITKSVLELNLQEEDIEIFDVEEEFAKETIVESNTKEIKDNKNVRFNESLLGELKLVTKAKAHNDTNPSVEKLEHGKDENKTQEKELGMPTISSKPDPTEKAALPLRNPSFLGAQRNPKTIPQIPQTNEPDEPNTKTPKAAGMNPLFLGELRQRLQVKPTKEISSGDTGGEPDKTNDSKDEQDITGHEGHKKVRPPPPERQTPTVTATAPKAETSQSGMRPISLEATTRNDFNVQSGDTLITGGIFNCHGKLLLIDNNERKLYVFTIQAECEDVLIFKEKPFDIANINANVVAITFPESGSVDLVDLISMQIVKSINVGEKCYGVDYYNSALIVRCSDSIKNVNLNGVILNSIRVHSSTEGYVAHYQDKIYYSHQNSLVCIDVAGNQQFVFQDQELEEAHGIATDFEGNVYVAGKNSNNIWELCGTDGSRRKKIVPVLIAPKVIAFNETKNRFLVAYDKSNTIIYDLKSTYGSII